MSSYIKRDCEIITQDQRQTISDRYKKITKAVNREFWNSISDTLHSFYVGSYGRHTAVDTSDIDILVELPRDEYERHDALKGNGQSRLLQDVKEAIVSSYPRSKIHADGQVIDIDFCDGIKFEVLPAFQHMDWLGAFDGTYTYPDTNMGGNWKSTNPKAEQQAMKEKNEKDQSNGLLVDTCQGIRRVRDDQFRGKHLPGIVIDSFVYMAIGGWHWTRENEQHHSGGSESYEAHLLKIYNSFTDFGFIPSLRAPGSNDPVDTEDCFDLLGKVLEYLAEH